MLSTVFDLLDTEGRESKTMIVTDTSQKSKSDSHIDPFSIFQSTIQN